MQSSAIDSRQRLFRCSHRENKFVSETCEKRLRKYLVSESWGAPFDDTTELWRRPTKINICYDKNMLITILIVPNLALSTRTNTWPITSSPTTQQNSRQLTSTTSVRTTLRVSQRCQTSTTRYRRKRTPSFSTTTLRRFGTRRFVTITGDASSTRRSFKTSKTFRIANRLWKCSDTTDFIISILPIEA